MSAIKVCVGICKAKYKAAGYTVAQISKQSLPCICNANPKKSYPNRYIQFYEEKIVTSSNRMEMITGEQLVSEYYKYFDSIEPEYAKQSPIAGVKSVAPTSKACLDAKKSIRSLPYNAKSIVPTSKACLGVGKATNLLMLDLIFNVNKHTPLNKHYTGKLSDIMGTTNIRDLKWVGVKFI